MHTHTHIGDNGEDFDVNNGVYFTNLKHIMSYNIIEGLLEYFKLHESKLTTGKPGNDGWVSLML